ncbi:hypothetical protein F3G89_12115 [Pseudomonas aeruginosa]|nr:hypothetical protein F3G89_12115 [Pseudomonas aeruginosa]MCO3673506.1 hypothetical protein [Pseudomonas aeruginosa]QDY03751.1 hypothetical protein FF962_22850 [Pseudomonas aeruginosa]RTU63917.1 hypothetical protein DZA25_08595 [Pseudomonas aeruginosa]RUG13013.1 hypothetical protein IPC761_17340 [Pseudomonas aeruginosa]
MIEPRAHGPDTLRAFLSTGRHPDRNPRARNAGGVIRRCPCVPRRITASGYSPCGSSFRRGWNLGA